MAASGLDTTTAPTTPAALQCAFYEHRLTPTWSILVLDTNDVGLQGASEEQIAEGKAWLEANRFRKPEAKPWNGGVGREQMIWATEALRAARREKRRLIVAGHMPLTSEASAPEECAWNHEELNALLDRFADVVVVYLAGHDHQGGYHLRPSGVHHVTVEGTVGVCPSLRGGHSFLSIHPDRIEIEGMPGGTTSRTLSFHHHLQLARL